MISTEEMLAHIEKLNRTWEEQGVQHADKDLFVGSLDAEALYPSLNTKLCGKECGRLVAESGLDIEGVDWRWATLYIALNCSQNEINRERLSRYCPRRKYKYGPRPGITTCGDPDACDKWVWHQDPTRMPPQEQQKVIAKLIEILVITTFETHVYAWGGRIYRQTRGGPIGVRASGTVAKVAMEK